MPHVLETRARLYGRALPTRASLDYMRATGLDLASLANHDAIPGGCGCLVVTAIRPIDADTFDLAEPNDPDAFTGAVIEAFGRDGETADDLVAWPLDDPARVLTMFRRVPMLGMWEAMNPHSYTFGKPLDLHRTPLEWLQADCSGAAILVPSLAARILVDLPGRFAPRDRKHAMQIDDLLKSLLRDLMVIPRQRRAAA